MGLNCLSIIVTGEEKMKILWFKPAGNERLYNVDFVLYKLRYGTLLCVNAAQKYYDYCSFPGSSFDFRLEMSFPIVNTLIVQSF